MPSGIIPIYRVLYTEIVDLLNCPKCQTIPCNPVVCSNGHATCKKCSEQNLFGCPKCSSIIVSNNHTLINTILEAVKSKENFLERLTHALECPVCYHQITECQVCCNGHGVCRSCAKWTQKCPLCREHYVYNYVSLINSLLFILKKRYPCKNWEKCKTCALYSELWEHEQFCDGTVSHCLLKTCNWRGSFYAQASHIIRRHPFMVLNEKKSLILKYERVKVRIFRAHNKEFWLYYWYKKNGLQLVIQINDNICNFTAEINIYTDKLYTYTLPIITLEDSVRDAMFRKDCLNIPEAELPEDIKDCKCQIKILLYNSDTSSLIATHILSMFLLFNVMLFCRKIFE